MLRIRKMDKLQYVHTMGSKTKQLLTTLKTIMLSERSQAGELILNDSTHMLVQTRQNPCERNPNSGCLWTGVRNGGVGVVGVRETYDYKVVAGGRYL